jgi:hypothetical protein
MYLRSQDGIYWWGISTPIWNRDTYLEDVLRQRARKIPLALVWLALENSVLVRVLLIWYIFILFRIPLGRGFIVHLMRVRQISGFCKLCMQWRGSIFPPNASPPTSALFLYLSTIMQPFFGVSRCLCCSTRSCLIVVLARIRQRFLNAEYEAAH